MTRELHRPTTYRRRRDEVRNFTYRRGGSQKSGQSTTKASARLWLRKQPPTVCSLDETTEPASSATEPLEVNKVLALVVIIRTRSTRQYALAFGVYRAASAGTSACIPSTY